MKRFKVQAKARDNFAHWVWGASAKLPGALLLADPKAIAVLDPESVDFRERLRESVWIYREEDFHEITLANMKLAGCGLRFRHIINHHPANVEDQLYHQLCAEPALADILRHRGKPV